MRQTGNVDAPRTMFENFTAHTLVPARLVSAVCSGCPALPGRGVANFGECNQINIVLYFLTRVASVGVIKNLNTVVLGKFLRHLLYLRKFPKYKKDVDTRGEEKITIKAGKILRGSIAGRDLSILYRLLLYYYF